MLTYEEKCKKLCQRLKDCSDAFAVVAGKGLPKAAMPLMKQEMKKQFSDTGKCEKECTNSDERGKDEAAMYLCLPMQDCRTFARCVLQSADNGKDSRSPSSGAGSASAAPAAGAKIPVAPRAGGVDPCGKLCAKLDECALMALAHRPGDKKKDMAAVGKLLSILSLCNQECASGAARVKGERTILLSPDVRGGAQAY